MCIDFNGLKSLKVVFQDKLDFNEWRSETESLRIRGFTDTSREPLKGKPSINIKFKNTGLNDSSLQEEFCTALVCAIAKGWSIHVDSIDRLDGK